MHKRKIALVSQNAFTGSGVYTMLLFLYQIIQQSELYEPTVVSIAHSSRDTDSTHLFDPKTWFQKITLSKSDWNNKVAYHSGANFVELEFQRYLPRKELTKLLNQFDLIQVVSGFPASALALINVDKPKCVFAATTVKEERASMISEAVGFKKLQLQIMTKIVSKMESRALTHVDHIFAESDYTKSLLLSLVSEAKVSLGVPGINTEIFYPNETYCDDGYILSVGRFADPRKNIKLLLSAYADLRKKNNNVPVLVLAGRDKLRREDWQFAVDLQVAQHVKICQDVQLKELAELYRNASMFVLSSNEEGLGIVLLEAMASGIPVISTRCGGPETCVREGDTGFLVPINDTAAMAKQMQILLSDPSLSRTIGQRARQLVEKRFSMKVAGEVYLHKYNQLLNISNNYNN